MGLGVDPESCDDVFRCCLAAPSTLDSVLFFLHTQTTSKKWPPGSPTSRLSYSLTS